MELSKVNLNLLVTLDALLSERNVSTVARKLFVTQPTVSIQLGQLREMFKDDLLVRSAKGMIPTKLGSRLAPRIKETLSQINGILSDTQIFNPEDLIRTFKIGIGPAIEPLIVPELYKYIRKFAPNVKLNFVAMRPMFETELIMNGLVDLAIGSWFGDLSPSLNKQEILTDDLVCVGREAHPLLQQKKLTKKQFLEAEFINFYMQPEYAAFLPDDIWKQFEPIATKFSNIPITVGYVRTLVNLLEDSDLLTILGSKTIKKDVEAGVLATKAIPFNLPQIVTYQMWLRCLDNDRELRWLREVIKNITDQIKS